MFLSSFLALPAVRARGCNFCPTVVAWCLALASIVGGREAQAGDYEVGPAPNWVEEIALGRMDPALRNQAGNGTFYLLSDVQLRHQPKLQAYYSHYASTAIDSEGLKQVANIEIEFNPSYERLVLHRIDVHREGRVFPRLAKATVRILQRETELERQLFDGTKTANVLLEDVRVGDVVEYAYTLEGQNPAFAGRDSGRFALQFNVPVGRVHVSLMHQESVRIKRHNGLPEPTESRVDGMRRLAWTQTDVAALPTESDEPGWNDVGPSVEWSQFPEWTDVVQWALPLYTPPAESGKAFALEVARLRREHADPEARIEAVLRFVQEEVRYLGISIGPGSHAPNPPALVLERRFGDCKDKSLLMVAMLRALDIEAVAALVNTSLRRGLGARQPRPTIFDHVVVRVRHKGQDYWLDPTRTSQRGQLETLAQADFDLALPVAKGADSLVAMSPSGSKVEPRRVEATIDASAGFDKPVAYTLVTTVVGSHADAFRSALAADGLESLQREYTNFYAGYYPGLTMAKPLAIDDDERQNRITFTERYTIADFARAEGDSGQLQASIYAPDIDSYLRGPAETTRRMPLYRNHPRDQTVVTEVLLPSGWDLTREHVMVDDPAFHYERLIEPRPDALRITDHYVSRVDEVPAEEVVRMAQNLAKARDTSAYELTWTPGATEGGPDASVGTFNWMLAVIAAMATVFSGWAAHRAWRFDPPPRAGAQAGDPVGLGGWLVLPGLGLIAMPLVTAFTYWQGRSAYTVESWHALTVPGGASYHALWAPGLLLDLVGGAMLSVAGLLVLMLFFMRRTSTPRFYIALEVASALQITIVTVLLHQIPDAQDDAAPREAMRAWVSAIIWSSYFLVSRRVRATFTRRLAQPAVADAVQMEEPAPIQGAALAPESSQAATAQGTA